LNSPLLCVVMHGDCPDLHCIGSSPLLPCHLLLGSVLAIGLGEAFAEFGCILALFLCGFWYWGWRIAKLQRPT